MRKVSILNEVIGPVMHGPSSSHTAASYHIGYLVRNLLNNEPATINISFSKNGSYAAVYHQQGSDRGFASGLLGWEITDDRFVNVLEEVKKIGLQINYKIEDLPLDDHPNAVKLLGTSKSGRKVEVMARSIGGGAIEITNINGWPVKITGEAYDILIEAKNSRIFEVNQLFAGVPENLGSPSVQNRSNKSLLHIQRISKLDEKKIDQIKCVEGVSEVWNTSPVFFAQPGEPLFSSGNEMIMLAEKSHLSLGQIALAYEAKLLCISEESLSKEMFRRYQIMKTGVQRGLDNNLQGMQFLKPTAGAILKAESSGRVAIGGMHTRAAARAMSVMQVDCSMGVVCAAPTGGSAGTIPGVITTLAEEKKLNEQQIVLALYAASAIGLILAIRGTFAAEIAGCQVEIGAAGAMSAALVVEVAGGSVQQACDAAAISLQNTMGSICDCVQGFAEIPCHTRNAIAASSAFVCADLILGGYNNPIPLDETIDAVMSVGRMLPRELRCTALGGLAITPSALALKTRFG
jgi:L-serine dehydratase